MPYPSQVDKIAIVEQARVLIEAEGVDALSLTKLASALGVKAPSLYRYVKNKAELLAEVSFLTFTRLVESLDPAKSSIEEPLNSTLADPIEKLVAITQKYRNFAQANPRTYVLAFTAENRGDEKQLVQLIVPVQRVVAQVVPAKGLRAALRGFMGLLHGFVMLEIHNQLPRGGDLGGDHEKAVRAYFVGWKSEGATKE